MKSYRSLKGQNRGASLIAVVTAIVFVGIIGAVVTQLTVTNIQMKEMEQHGKTHFYSAEEVMDDLVSGLNVKASEQMQQAYLKILSQYRTVTASDDNLQAIFKKMYVQNLVECFGGGPEGQVYVQPAEDGNYEIGKFKISVLLDCFSVDEYKDKLMVSGIPENADLSQPSYHADYLNGRFVLKDIEVQVKEENTDYYTKIHTDIVFNAPNLRFDEGNMIREFMRYSLIADQQVEVLASSTPGIDGNVYAGAKGILGLIHSNAKFVGNTIVTRGDVAVRPGGSITIGDKAAGRAVELWAENLRTEPFNSSSLDAFLSVYGSAYIEDDLEINAKNSKVKLEGNYYGYNFQKSYSSANADSTNRGPEFSSTIAVNAANANLDLTGLDNLWLAGRTYLSKNIPTDDVLLGESLSVRSSQLAYYVPDALLDLTAGADHPKLLDPTGDALEEYLGIDNVSSYINLDDPVVVYHFQNLSSADIMYFLKFKSDSESQAANEFFAEYYNKNKDRMDSLAGRYLDNSALLLGSMAVTLKGDILYRGTDNQLHATEQAIVPEQWAEGGAMYNRAGIWNAKYQSLQLWLEESNDSITPASDRFTEKDTETLYSHLINEEEFNNLFGASTGAKAVWSNATAADSATDRYAVVLVKEDDLSSHPYILDADKHICGGIIIANCDVIVKTNFSGLIISKGTIELDGNVQISANEVLVSKLFSDDLIRPMRWFTPAFKGYEVLTDENIGTVNVNKYLTYDNWSKTLE